MDAIGEVFGQRLDDIVALARDSKFKACFLSSADLTRFASMSGFKHGVLITEVLENVFLEVGQTLSRHQVLQQDRADVTASIYSNMSLLSSVYKDEDKSAAYRVLEDLRFEATKFQIRCVNTTEPVGDMPTGIGW